MSDDLKETLIDTLGWTKLNATLIARLEKATVTEPAPAPDPYAWVDEESPEKRLVSLQMAATQGYYQFSEEATARMAARVRQGFAVAPPTDADLREQLRAALGEGWNCIAGIEDRYVYADLTGTPHGSRVAYSALRAPGGVARCAAAVKVLAGAE